MRSKVRVVWLHSFVVVFFVAAVVMLTAVGLEAETGEKVPLLTVVESIQIALERNLDMQVAQEEVQAALHRQKEATTSFLPSLRAEYSYRYLSEVPYAVFEGREIDFADQDQYRFTGTIEQPLFTGFATVSNYQLAKLGLNVAEIQLARARLDLILQVREAYFGILSADKIHEVAGQSVESGQVRRDQRRLDLLARALEGVALEDTAAGATRALGTALAALDWEPATTPRRHRIDLWSGWPYLTLITALLATEWFLRRRHGLL